MRTNDDDDGIDNDGYCRCRCDKYTSNPSMIDITVMPCTRYIQPLFFTDLPCTCTALSLSLYIYIYLFFVVSQFLIAFLYYLYAYSSSMYKKNGSSCGSIFFLDQRRTGQNKMYPKSRLDIEYHNYNLRLLL